MNTPMEELLQSTHNWRAMNSAKIDEMVINRLLEHSPSLDNYTHAVVGIWDEEAERGHFTLADKKVLRYYKAFNINIDNNTMNSTMKYEVYDYIANEFLYLEDLQ